MATIAGEAANSVLAETIHTTVILQFWVSTFINICTEVM